jgi:hypothetical protein
MGRQAWPRPLPFQVIIFYGNRIVGFLFLLFVNRIRML